MNQLDTVLPPVVGCDHCSGRVRWMPTDTTRMKVNADPDRERGNIRWLATERVCVTLGPVAAATTRADGRIPLYVFHGLDCPATRAMSSRPRPPAERRDPPAKPATRQTVLNRIAEQLGWKRR